MQAQLFYDTEREKLEALMEPILDEKLPRADAHPLRKPELTQVNATRKVMFDTELNAVAQEAKAAAVIYETLAEVLLNPPTDRILSDVKHVAALLDVSEFDHDVVDEVLMQQFYDCMFVASSSSFVPLSESRIRSTTIVGGVRYFGPSEDINSDHVLKCYRVMGFDYTLLSGYLLVIQTLRPDSLASELAFLAAIAQAEAKAAAYADASALYYRSWRALFIEHHLGCWIDQAAAVMHEKRNDFFARICSLAAAWVALERTTLKVSR
ncbi:MAG: molecular chaperone TorD family protein [Gordonibacter sp.]